MKSFYPSAHPSAPEIQLAHAIILQAARDYRDALYRLKRNPRSASASRTRYECEEFFRSEWFRALTGLDGKYLIHELQKETNQHDSKRIS